jgi:NAD(P)-dependent dehydrogenase (short-subunit alcohol dehydrogenase family)
MKFTINNLPSQKGRIAIVTGANIGLGFETALALSKTEMKVIMACRNLEKAQKAKDKIIKKVPKANLELIHMDLSRLDSVRNFAKIYLENYARLDLLINNAGVMMSPFHLTKDGIESQFSINYLGHFLLTGILLPTLEKTDGSRVISLSSLAHKNGKIEFDDLQSEKSYSAYGAYCQSKLACLMFAYELQRRLNRSKSKVIAVAAHPGVAETNLFQHFPRWLLVAFGWLLRWTIIQSAKHGAEPTLYAALGNDIQGGDYIGPDGWKEMRGKPAKVDSTTLSKDTEIAKRLWDVSERLTNINYL